MQGGVVSLPKSQVLRVESRDSDLSGYLRRQEALRRNPDTRARDWLDLARWAKAQGLEQGARDAALAAAELDPKLDGLEPLLRGFRYTYDDQLGRWIPYEEAMRRRGFVLAGGAWISREEMAERNRQREASEAQAARIREAARADRAARQTEMLLATQTALLNETIRDRGPNASPYTSPYSAYAWPVVVIPGYYPSPCQRASCMPPGEGAVTTALAAMTTATGARSRTGTTASPGSRAACSPAISAAGRRSLRRTGRPSPPDPLSHPHSRTPGRGGGGNVQPDPHIISAFGMGVRAPSCGTIGASVVLSVCFEEGGLPMPESLFKRVAVFEGLPEEWVAELSAASEERRFDGNSVVFRKDDPCDGLYVVSRGGVVVRNEVVGQPIERVQALGPGDVFGEAEALDAVPRQFSARTLGPTVVYRIPEEPLLNVLKRHPEIEVSLRAPVPPAAEGPRARADGSGEPHGAAHLDRPRRAPDPQNGERIVLRLENLSTGGACLSPAPEDWRLRKPLRFTLGIESKPELLRVSGVVRWRLGRAVGVAFDGAGPALRRRVHEALSELLPRTH